MEGRLVDVIGVNEADVGPDGVGGRCRWRGKNYKNVFRPQSPVHDNTIAAVECHHEIANAGVVDEL